MPGSYCAVVGCHNSLYQLQKWKKEYCDVHKITFGLWSCICEPPFKLNSFPTESKDPARRKQWIQNVNRQDANTGRLWCPTRSNRICSKHFIDGEPTLKNPNPSLHMGHEGTSLLKTPRRVINKHDGPLKKKQKLMSSDVLELGALQTAHEETNQVEMEPETTTLLNDSTVSDHAYCTISATDTDQRNEDIVYQRLKNRIKELEEEVNTKPKVANVNDSSAKMLKTDKKCKYYTGLPSKEHFDLLLEYVKPKDEKMAYWRGTKKVISTKRVRTFVRSPKKFGPQRKITTRDELLLVLMKLRLGLMNEDIADRFGITPSAVSSIFTTWIKVLSNSLKGLIYYPDKISTRANLPECFASSYPRLRCIVDCTEFFIERPRELFLQAVTWSDYKKHNTVKVLIGITPRGSISFVSDAWGGRSSDRHITLNSDFLNHIHPGDQIMADRGFLIREELMVRRAELVLPPAAKGAQQMSAGDVRATKEIANLRIHVERAIQRLKTFRMLKNTLPLTYLPLIDDIVQTCAALCNLYSPLVK